MGQANDILLLAGSAEARQIARRLLGQGLGVLALVSEPPKGPNPMPVPFEMWDFSDPAALVDKMRGYTAVIDASHGFDGVMSAAGFAAATQIGLPFMALTRPKWDVNENPNWQACTDVRAAMPLIPKGARVFSATGWASLRDYADFPGETLFVRQTTRHERAPPFDFMTLEFGDPPFSVADETALFRRLNVDVLICRNLGGMPSRPKLDAASALNMQAILIEGPTLPPEVPTVSDVDSVMAWVAQQ